MATTVRSLSLLAALSLAAPAARGQGGRVLEELECPAAEPMGMAWQDGALWISDMASRSLLKVRPTDGAVLDRIEASGLMPTGLGWHDGVLYSADRRRERIARRRPGAETDLSPIPYYERWATGIAHDGESLWVVDARANALHRLDPDDGTTIESLPAPAGAPTGLAFDGRHLWVADHGADELYRVDRRDGSVVAILPAPGPYPSALAFHDGELWVADYQLRKLHRIELPGEVPYVEDRERRATVSYEVVYRVGGPGRVEELTVALALPRDIPGQHLLGELSFEPEPARFETDRWGQRAAVVELGRLASGETATVRWEGDFALLRTRFHLDPDVVDRGALPPETAAYLVDDRKYDMGSPVVVELVERLTSGEPGRYGKARALYQHLAEVISYDRSSGWNNAATVLERGTGSCSEYTFALVALLRRAGIPARYVGALSERGDEASFDDVFHRWAEAYLPGYGWVPLDANAAHGEPPGVQGSFFGGRSNRHVVTTIGGGASELLDWTYNSHETYRTVGAAELEVRPIARYRPLEGGPEAEPHEAPRVLAPRPTDPPGAEGDRPSPRAAPYWLVALVGALGLALGLGLGRRRSPPLSLLLGMGLAGAAVLSATACLDDGPDRPRGARCSSRAQCAADLVCVYGRCRSSCLVDRDCGEGGLCVRVFDEAGAPTDGRVCALPEDAGCQGVGCPPVGSGEDGTVAESCVEHLDCPPERPVCGAAAGLCAATDDGFPVVVARDGPFAEVALGWAGEAWALAMIRGAPGSQRVVLLGISGGGSHGAPPAELSFEPGTVGELEMAVAADTGDPIVVAWTDRSGTRTTVRAAVVGSEASPDSLLEVQNDVGPVAEPSVAVSAERLFLAATGSGDLVLLSSPRRGEPEWGPLSDGLSWTRDLRGPRLAPLPDGGLALLWAAGDPGSEELLLSRLDGSGGVVLDGVPLPGVVSSASPSFQRLACRADGMLGAAWLEETGGRDLPWPVSHAVIDPADPAATPRVDLGLARPLGLAVASGADSAFVAFADGEADRAGAVAVQWPGRNVIFGTHAPALSAPSIAWNDRDRELGVVWVTGAADGAQGVVFARLAPDDI